MRVVFTLLLLVLSLVASSKWYQNLKSSKPNSYIGYGSKVDELEAKKDALSDIVSQISVKIVSSFTDDIKEINGKLSSVTHSKTSQNASAVLNDYKIIRSEYKNGKYYVAIEYENITSLDRFIKKLKKSPSSKKSEKQNSYIKHTKMAKILKKELSKNINFKLLRKDKKWYIKYKSVIQALNKKDFSSFFTSIHNNFIEIRTNKKRDILYDGDRFFFKVKSKKSGFISILTVYEDGTVSTLVRNISIKKEKIENIPDENFETIAEAGLMQKGVETYDIFR